LFFPVESLASSVCEVVSRNSWRYPDRAERVGGSDAVCVQTTRRRAGDGIIADKLGQESEVPSSIRCLLAQPPSAIIVYHQVDTQNLVLPPVALQSLFLGGNCEQAKSP
jgi:hypothetical protein